MLEAGFAAAYTERLDEWDKQMFVRPRCSRWVGIAILAGKMGVDRWYVGKALQDLEKKGLVLKKTREDKYSLLDCPLGFVYDTSLLVQRSGF